jgi:stage II sporulation protein D
MFYKYNIINNGKEEILYLYLTMKYEFSQELDFNNYKNLTKETKNFIKSNNINFKGNKVYLIVDGIVVKTVEIDKDYPHINDNSYSADKFIINIKYEDNSIKEIYLREYLISMLFSHYTININIETLKAIAILYNTYAYKMMSENNYIISNNCFVEYKPSTLYKNTYNNYNEILNIINNVIDEIDCMYLSYNNKYILPFIHYSNNGKTLSNKNYPYLSSVKSLWDITSPYYVEVKNYTYQEINNKLNISISCNSNINITDKNISFDNNMFTKEEIRNIFNIKSSDMYIIINNDNISFISRGWGNFYGLSIYGSNCIANNGGKYFNILKYYFPKTKLYKYTKELS